MTPVFQSTVSTPSLSPPLQVVTWFHNDLIIIIMMVVVVMMMMMMIMMMMMMMIDKKAHKSKTCSPAYVPHWCPISLH